MNQAGKDQSTLLLETIDPFEQLEIHLSIDNQSTFITPESISLTFEPCGKNDLLF